MKSTLSTQRRKIITVPLNILSSVQSKILICQNFLGYSWLLIHFHCSENIIQNEQWCLMKYSPVPSATARQSNISWYWWSIMSTHYCVAIMGTVASQITSLTIVYTTVYSDADQSKHQSSASLAFVWGIHRGLVNSPHKGPVTRKMFPFDDVIMRTNQSLNSQQTPYISPLQAS